MSEELKEVVEAPVESTRKTNYIEIPDIVPI